MKHTISTGFFLGDFPGMARDENLRYLEFWSQNCLSFGKICLSFEKNAWVFEKVAWVLEKSFSLCNIFQWIARFWSKIQILLIGVSYFFLKTLWYIEFCKNLGKKLRYPEFWLKFGLGLSQSLEFWIVEFLKNAQKRAWPK